MNDKLKDKRTQILWVHSSIDDMTHLSPNAMRVYMHLVRRANGCGLAWPGLQSIGDHCFATAYKHPDSRRKHAIAALAELVEANLIRKETRITNDGQKSNHYHLLDPVTVQSQPTVTVEAQRAVTVESPPPVTVQSHEGNPIEGNPIEGNPIDAGASNPLTPLRSSELSVQQEMFGAICEALGWDYHVISDKNKGQVAQAIKVLVKANYTVDDIRRFMVEVWFKDWRWQKNQQYPTLAQLREDIGKIRSLVPSAAPAKKKTGIEGYREMLARQGITI
jgi:hypothetical protein